MAKHKLAWTVAAVVGVLYLLHMWNNHGTGKQVLAGLGINR